MQCLACVGSHHSTEHHRFLVDNFIFLKNKIEFLNILLLQPYSVYLILKFLWEITFVEGGPVCFRLNLFCAISPEDSRKLRNFSP